MPKLTNILDKGGYSMSYKKAILRSSYIFLATFFVLNSVAQEVEEVVVTATKKEESTQDLAISVEAFTSEMLEQNQIYDISDLTEVVPGFGTGKGIGSGSAFSMRGIGSYGIGAAVVSSLVTNINGHSVGTGQFVDLGMMDIERIEVLKGPQGTINGRNSVQGVVNVITARPTDEFGGYVDVETGNFDMKRMTTALNLPINDNVKTRLAFMTNMRDGMVYNPVTGNDFDDRNDMGLRFSLDWDISDTTDFKLTYSGQKSDDNRPQEEVSFCAQDPFFGCRPDIRGGLNQAADTRGHVAGFVGFVAHLDPGTIVNKYGPSLSDKFDTLYLDREPTHLQTSEVTNLELTHDISDDVQMIAKYTYSTRDFHQMNDNDGSVSNVPLAGAGAGLGLAPIEAYVCFGSDENSFCETVDSDRTYDFSDVETENKQAEINFISDFDGPFNFSAGYYWYDDTTDNEYRVQTAGTQLIGSFANHPYSAVLAGLTGVDLSSKGGAVFYQTVLQGLLPQLPNVLAVQGGAITDPVQVATIIGTYQATLGMLQAMPDVVVPLGLRGTLSDQHVRTQSQAFYGEMYFDLSEDTKLTLGGRYDDFLVNSHNFNDLLGNAYIRLGCFNYSSHTTCPGIEQQRTVEDDSTSFKVALQHNLNDDVMVYGSYTTAVKAGGVNAGSSSSTYDQEETGVLDFGMKSILMDGAMLLNMNIFRNDNKGMLLAAIVDDASINYNVDAEITGFEGNLSVFLTETTNLSFNWLLIDNEITSDTSIINYMNPLGAMYDVFLGPVGNDTGLLTGAVFNGTTQLFKSGGYNCLSPMGTNALGVVGGFAPLAGSVCTVAQGVPQSIKGNKLPNTADSEYSLSLTQVFPSARGETLAKLSYRYRSESNSSNFEEARMAIPDLKVWDLFVRFNPNDDDWYVGMYAKNLADDRQLGFLRTASNLQGGQLYGSFSDPRTFGVQFGTSF